MKILSIHDSIQKIRHELTEFLVELGGGAAAIQAVEQLSNEAILSLYVQATFDVDWRGDVLEQLVSVTV